MPVRGRVSHNVRPEQGPSTRPTTRSASLSTFRCCETRISVTGEPSRRCQHPPTVDGGGLRALVGGERVVRVLLRGVPLVLMFGVVVTVSVSNRQAVVVGHVV
jgi:hypothetical protein